MAEFWSRYFFGVLLFRAIPTGSVGHFCTRRCEQTRRGIPRRPGVNVIKLFSFVADDEAQ